MRSKVSHFSGIIRFVIFLCVILLLIYVIVHWSRQNSHQPVATNPSTNSQTVEPNNKGNDNNTNNQTNNNSTQPKANNKTQSSTSDKETSSKSDHSRKSTTKQNKPSKIAGDTGAGSSAKSKQQPATSKVPSTGLSLEQAFVAAVGIGLTVYLTGNYLQTKNWHQLNN